MLKRCLLFFTLFAIYTLQGQEQLLPPDFRQHNITEYNSSFLSPVFALDRNNPQSVALWTRWQWQNIDGDPTTLFLNYTRRLNTESVAGIGFFQNNTGVFLQTGGVLNYAYALDLESDAQIAFGLNLFGFVRKLADTYQPDPNIGLPILAETNDFILRLDPSLRFKLDRFSIGIVAENLFDYNFSTSEKDTGPMEKVYIGLASYSFPVTIFGSSENSFIQPTVYMKTLPNYDNQFGFTTLFSNPKFWVQAGYNNFYGISGGAGARLFNRFSLGALVEFGASDELSGRDPTFEFVTSYKLGPIERKGKIKTLEEEEEEEEPLITEEQLDNDAATTEEAAIDKKEERRLAKEAQLAERQRRKDSIADVRAQQKLAVANQKATEKKQDSITREEKRLNLIEAEKIAQQRQDSLAEVRAEQKIAEATKIREQNRNDSIVAVQRAAELEAARQLAMQRKQDSISAIKKANELEAIRLAEQKTKDSLAEVRNQQRLAEAARIAQQKRNDSIASVQRTAELEAARQLAMQRKQDSIKAIKRANELEAIRLAEQQTKDSLAEVRKRQRLVEAAKIADQKRKDSLVAVRKAEAIAAASKIAEQKTRDSLAGIRTQEQLALKQAEEQKRIQDSVSQAKAALAAQQPKEVVEPKAGEKYEEAVTEDGLEPGFYLIANVFGTKKYFESFMVSLKDQGLRPRSFFRSLNKYNYVYLQRYDSMTEARKARDSKFNGRYQGKTWIFRVVVQ